jgi:hypothetical protein
MKLLGIAFMLPLIVFLCLTEKDNLREYAIEILKLLGCLAIGFCFVIGIAILFGK